MNILSIETSCDETAVAVIKGNEKSRGFEVLSNVVSSQVKIHAKWGGVVPNLAAREHLKNFVPVLDEALKSAKIELKEIDLVSVTQGPGLIPALLLGTNGAKTLAHFLKKPLLGIHHVEGHICSNYIEEKDDKKYCHFDRSEQTKRESGVEKSAISKTLVSTDPSTSPLAGGFARDDRGDGIREIEKRYFGSLDKFKFPILSLIISGGHTQLILMKDFFDYQIVGETQDDAVGEAFDKVAKILGLGYPGGPIVSKMAVNHENPLNPPSKRGREIPNPLGSSLKNGEDNLKILPNPPFLKEEDLKKEIKFPRPMLNSGNLDFSFSGLKTAVLYFWKDVSNPFSTDEASRLRSKKELELLKKNVCFEFEEAVSEVLCKKSEEAIKKYKPQTFLLAGGVAANKRLRADLKNVAKKNKIDFSCPLIEFCGDNAVMIGVAAFSRYLKLKKDKDLDSLKNEWRDLEAQAQMELR